MDFDDIPDAGEENLGDVGISGLSALPEPELEDGIASVSAFEFVANF